MLMSDLVAKLKRRLRDTENEFSNLEEYIEDAIDELYYLFDDLSVQNAELTREVTSNEATVIVIQAQILIETGLKSSGDRSNFKIRKENITIDNTQQSKDHATTLELLYQELDKAILRNITGDINYIRVE